MFISTRTKIKTSASKAILEGLAKDGGLYVFDHLEKLNIKEDWVNLSYKEVAFKVLRLFLDDFSDDEIKYAIEEAYGKKNFNNIVTYDLNDEFAILNLYNGPTFAFKDMALSILPYLVKVAKTKNNDENQTVVLTATSGDTGSAALAGFKQVEGNKVIVLYPNNSVSDIQEAQMLSLKSENTFPIAINGNFDDCQRAVKEYFNTRSFNGIDLSSANSINIGRLIPQIVYYVYSYLYLVKNNKIKFNEKINVSVPTGNFGNIFASKIAKEIGTPIDKIICASNENNVLTDFFNTKVYDANRLFKKTNSPSMDILISSNLERYLYFITKDEKAVAKLMDELKKNKKYKLDEKYHDKMNDFEAYYTNEDETCKIIKKVFDKYNILIDPHTAVAFNGYLKSSKSSYTLVVSTASPYKFIDTISKSLNLKTDYYKIEEYTKTKIDNRMKDLIGKKYLKEVWNKEDILSNIDKIIKEMR